MLVSTISVDPALAKLTIELARLPRRVAPDFAAILPHYDEADALLARVTHALDRDLPDLQECGHDAYLAALLLAKLLSRMDTTDPATLARRDRLAGTIGRMLDVLERIVSPVDRALRSRLQCDEPRAGVDATPVISRASSARFPGIRGGN